LPLTNTSSIGTVLKVTNLIKYSFCYVRVKDRPPNSSKFIIDFSYETSKQPNFWKKGVITVILVPVDKVKIFKIITQSWGLLNNNLLMFPKQLFHCIY
jgi:rare lipoprotein A (peptidoglycan hydrolase)